MIRIVAPPTGTSRHIESISAHYVGSEPSLSNLPFPATLSGQFRHVEGTVEAPWLECILTHLPTLLPALAEAAPRERLKQLVELTCPVDWRAQNSVRFSIEGHTLAQELFRTIPLLTEQEVRDQTAPLAPEQWPQLMQLTYHGQTFYLADQFDEQGHVIPFCLALVTVLKRDPQMTDWDIAVWWINPTGWLSGASPRQRYQEDPEAVWHAAEQEALRDD